jgi:DNA-binding NarL/FixJ family response regulator
MVNPGRNNIQTMPTIVVSRPGVLQQSLRATLAAHPWIQVVASPGDGLTALNLVIEHQPKLMVIDSNLLAEEIDALLAAVKVKVPATRCLVCAQSSRQIAPLLALGADAVIVRDSPAQQWQTTLRQLAQDGTDHQR